MASIGLSFDDGPGPSTQALLDVLYEMRCTAVFFLLGVNLEQNMPAATRMIREGHTVGNHTYFHSSPTDMSIETLAGELEATDALIREAYRRAKRNAPESIPVRLPYGVQKHDPRLKLLNKLERPHMGWTAIFDDWRRPAPSAMRLFEDMLRHIEKRVSLGQDVQLCLHDSSRHQESRPATVEAVRLLLSSPRYQALLADDARG